MATISKGIQLIMNDVALTNLMEVPELGGDTEAIEITTLADVAHVYTDGIKNYGDSLAFKFLYDQTQFMDLSNGTAEASEWEVHLPDGTVCAFSGTHSVKLDGVGVNAALTYTLSVKPNSAMTWAKTSA